MVDVFRHLHGYGDAGVPDTSHNGRRIDHLIASKSLNPVECRYDHGLEDCGDHAPLVARFDP
jgi:exonuclease III